jgi:hypothetical protein
LPNVKNATSYFENGLKNRFRAIEFRADDYLPFESLLENNSAGNLFFPQAKKQCSRKNDITSFFFEKKKRNKLMNIT